MRMHMCNVAGSVYCIYISVYIADRYLAGIRYLSRHAMFGMLRIAAAPMGMATAMLSV